MHAVQPYYSCIVQLYSCTAVQLYFCTGRRSCNNTCTRTAVPDHTRPREADPNIRRSLNLDLNFTRFILESNRNYLPAADTVPRYRYSRTTRNLYSCRILLSSKKFSTCCKVQ